MVFSSIIFLFFFLPVALAAFYFPWNRHRRETLLVLSLVFYAWGAREGILILGLSIVVNYCLGVILCRAKTSNAGLDRGIESARHSITSSMDRIVLVIGVAFNIGLLVFYKYIGFLVDNFNQVAGWTGIASIKIDPIAIPLGISFFTFHAISYLVDLYRSDSRASRNPLDLALYFAFFPKVLAGPIVQFNDARDAPLPTPAAGSFGTGVERFTIGLGKKVLIASPLAAAADNIFGAPVMDLTTGAAWLGIMCYTLQIYFDFSGYTDMAVGVGRMFGVRLPENFNYPYISQSIGEFWRRWHISLSRWLREYVYIPLGGNRCSTERQFLNLITVFLLCGIWHGANWTFMIWGLWYGVFLVLERTAFGTFLSSVPRFLRHAYTMGVVVVGWVFFRAESLPHAIAYLGAMAGISDGTSPAGTFLDNEVILCLVAGVVASMPFQAFLKNILRSRPKDISGDGRVFGADFSPFTAAFLGLLFLLSCMSLAGGTHKAFIYFKF